MEPRRLLALLLLLPLAANAAGPALADDPVLGTFVAEALAQRPELAQAQALIAAGRERVPQARAFPDPALTLGIQNDGFTGIQIGRMETSWVSVMVSQTVPWYGKRGLRADAADLGVRLAEADLARARLSIRAEVERAYVDLLLARDQLALLTKLDALWLLSEGMARTRYESGEGAQSDLLRAQLERSRLGQRRWALEAEARRRAAVLNRLRGKPLDEAVETARSLADVPDPLLDPPAADLEAQSPDVQRADLAVAQNEKQAALAGKDYFPDPTLSAGVMPRGRLEPMWQLSLSFTLPVWAAFKQSPATQEARARQRAAADGAEAVRQLLRQRMHERRLVLEALLQSNRLYRSGLLVLSESTVTSTMGQYQVGKVTFASVLEALVGYVNDLNGFLESAAETQRLAIAQRALSLDPVTGPAFSVPGAAPAASGSSPASPSSGM